MSGLLDFFNARRQQEVEFLRELIEFETPTHDKSLVDKLGKHLHGILIDMGADITVHPRQVVGDIQVARWNRGAEGKPIMFLCHIDTVWPEGTLRDDMPIVEDENIIWGPGALDMKGGITCALDAIKGLQERDEFPDHPVWLVLTTDEETGSVYSKDLIHELAQEAGLVLVTELAGENEAVKTWRKGVARYWVKSKGLASHSGNAPEAGINAIIDIANQALKVDQLNDLLAGTSVCVTQMKGGITLNVIPPEAEMYIDVRFLKQTEYERVNEAIRALEPIVLGAQLEVTGYLDRPPMERNTLALQTYSRASKIAESIGLTISETGSGGGSDGNFTAAQGIPTLDGMGPQGEGIHAKHEQVYKRSMPRRAALMAGILRDWQMDL
jgi:glutamate carboxypeptidase